jgi:hypothetical protein
LNRWLIEISEVDDELNDDYVEVGIYKGIDRIMDDALLKPIVGQSQRIDLRFPKYNVKTTGKIINGVLSTAPVDRPFVAQDFLRPGQHLLRGLQLRLKLDNEGVTGYVGGYEDLKQLWWYYANDHSGQQDAVALWDPPAVYDALNRLADGFPDPKTGKNTAISAAYSVHGVRASLIRPTQGDLIAKEVSAPSAVSTGARK